MAKRAKHYRQPFQVALSMEADDAARVTEEALKRGMSRNRMIEILLLNVLDAADELRRIAEPKTGTHNMEFRAFALYRKGWLDSLFALRPELPPDPTKGAPPAQKIPSAVKDMAL